MAELNELSRQELAELCTARGLPTYGTKPVLVARLTAADEAGQPQPGADAETEADPFADEEPDDGAETVDVDGSDEEPVLYPVPTVETTTPIRSYKATYDVDEWDDDTHDELCARVVAEAQAAGHRTRGGGHRVGGQDRSHTYEVSVR